jgi:hypothetical protein
MTMLSPAATYHAELREQLDSVGRALAIQRALLWLARGLAVGTIVVLGLVMWAWITDRVPTLQIPLLVALPIATGAVTAVGTIFIRHRTPELARRVDRAARLQERSTTALELGAQGVEYPLAVAQMRDAVEHLKRVDLLEAFPLRMPRHELLTAFFVVLVAAIVAVSPNPWVLRARATNPAISIAREQAQRVQRLADSIQPANSPELDALRQLVSKGARTIDARSNEPDAALNSLQDLEEQVQQMSAGDDQLAAALAAISSALAANSATQPLSDAINTGDMRQIAQATKDLAAASQSMSSQDQASLAKALQDAAQAAGRVSQSVSGQLSDAADALQGSGASAGSASGDPSQASQSDQTGQQAAGSSTAQNGRSASDALNQLSNSAAAAGERQRAASQLESSRNALERALGRTQSRSGSNSTNSRSSSSSQNGQNSNGQNADQSPGAGQGQPGDQTGDGTDGTGGGASGNGQGQGGDTGQGGGYSTGGQNQNNTGASSSLDGITSDQQVPTNGSVTPDESQTNPYLGDAGTSSAQAQSESVQPSYSSKPTQGNDTGSIPLGMRDLVKDYFSSLDQK